MKCKSCQNIYNLSNEDDEIVGKWCPKINDSPDVECDRECDKYKPMTNADRIRNMTDEELAEFFKKIGSCLASGDFIDCSSFITCNGCDQRTLQWLQAEVKEGAEHG